MLFDDEGRQINPNLTNYIMPTSLDMPDIEVDIVDNYDPTGPFAGLAYAIGFAALYVLDARRTPVPRDVDAPAPAKASEPSPQLET